VSARALQLLPLLSLRHFRRHLLRTTLALSSVALGVAAFLAMVALNRGILDSFERAARMRAGGAELVLRGGRGGMALALADEVAQVPGVRAAVPTIVRSIETTRPVQVTALLVGLDPARAPDVGGLVPKDVIAAFASPLALLKGGVPIFVPEKLGADPRFALGEAIELATPRGVRTMRVAGYLRDGWMPGAFGGYVFGARLSDAMALTSVDGSIDRVQLFLTPGVDAAKVRADVERVLAGRAVVSDPLELAREYDATLGSFRLGLRFLSMLSLLIAAFLVHSTLSMALAERRRELSIARCLGLPAAGLRRLLVLEGAAIGVVGAAGGLLLGRLLARLMSQLFWDTVGSTFDRIDAVVSSPTLGESLLGAAAGLLAALIAVVPPALSAARRTPLEGLRAERTEARAVRPRLLLLAGAVVLATSSWLLIRQGGLGVPHAGYVAAILLVAAFALGAHPLLSLLLARTGPLLLRVLGPAGRLARDHCERAVGPTSLTVVAITLAFGLVYSTDVLVTSYERMLDDWFDETVGEELFVMSRDFLSSGLQGASFDAALADDVRRIPGVLHVHALRFSRMPYAGDRVLLLALDGAAPAKAGHAHLIDGEEGDRARLGRGEGVFVSEGFARRFGKGRGSSVELPTPRGLRSFEVLAVVADYTWPRGVLWIDDDLYRATFDDHEAQEFGITLDGTRPLDAVRGDVARLFSAAHPGLVIDQATVRANVMAIFHRYWALLLAQEGLAVTVAFLGTLHTLLISVLLRRREIALLRALGAPRRLIGRMIRTEGVLLGVAGGAFGVLFGIGTAAAVLRLLSLEEQGFSVVVRPSWTVALATVAGAALTGLLAGWVPARAAARAAPRTALLDTMA
jgi:putative ABC transport system permease protein